MTLSETILFSPIAVMLDDVNITNRCKFSWSTDMVNWSCWNDYDGYVRVCGMLETDFYLRILFKESKVPALFINNILVSCYTVNIYYTNPFLNDPCSIISNSGFDLYSGWDCALMMQQQLSDQVICMVGIPVFYFRVTPDSDTKSYTFKEYVLHNVESVKQIKMMITDGTMPSSKPSITEWDMEFETDWETELSKTQFATAFGTEAFPKQRDFIWVPMQKRMYMVNTAYEEKNENLLWRAVTWKLALVKWQDQSNVDQGDFESIIDNLIVNKYSEVFEEGENREGELTGTLQVSSPHYEATNLYSLINSDYIRKQISIDTMKIADRQVNHGNIIVAKNKYIFYNDSVITYQKDWCGNDGTLSLIFDTPAEFIDEEKTILKIGEWELKLNSNVLTAGKCKLNIKSGKTYILVLRWSHNMGTMTMNLYVQSHPDVPSYRLKPTMYSFDFNNPLTSSSSIDEKLVGGPYSVVLYGYPLQICNLKLYNKYINDDKLDEILKYSTKDEYCIINDQARPLNGEHGYAVR